MLGSEAVTQVAELALLIVAVGGIAWCFCSPMLRNSRMLNAKRQRRTAIQAQERAAKIMRERRLNERYAADAYSR